MIDKIMFIHVPKCGGSFIAANIATSFGYHRTFSVDLENITLDHFTKYKDGIVNEYDFLTGHIPFSFVASHVARFDVVFGIVRSPFQRAISTYTYLIRNAGEQPTIAAFEEFVNRHFFNNRATRNEQCGYLGRVNTCASVAETLNAYRNFRILRFWNLERELTALFQECGIAYNEKAERNASKSSAKFLFDLVSPSFLSEFVNWFSGDYLLCDMLSERNP